MDSSSASSAPRYALASVFAGAVAAVWLMAGTALAAPAFSLQRATSAPADIASLTQYAMQMEDTTDVQSDTSLQGDSLPGLPQNLPAPVETIAPPPVSSPSTPAAGETKPPAPTKRPLFGLSSIALVAGLVALHIFVVSLVAK